MRKGSITIFLALILPLIVVLLFTLIESARYAGLRSVAKTVVNSAADSVFAGYNRTLFDEYGVLFYDGGNGQGTIRYDDLEGEMLRYIQKNIPDPGRFGGTFFPFGAESAETTELVAATDYDGEVFIRSVLDFYKYDAVGSIAETVMNQLKTMREGETLKNGADRDTNKLKDTDWSGVPVSDAGSEVRNVSLIRRTSGDQTGGGGALPEGEAEGPEPIDDRKLKSDIKDSAIGAAETSKAKGWLALVLPAGTDVSAYAMDQSDAPSLSARDGRTLAGGSGIVADAVEGLGFYEYILSHYGCYTAPLRDSGMRYEIEYILYGKATDVQNFRTALDRIMWIREGMNLLYLVTSEHRTEANALAETMVGWTGNQLIVMLTATALMAAWAYAESILDVRAMLQHKRVAFMKTEATWVLSIGGIENLLAGGGEAAREDEGGLRYEDYLRLLLYAGDEHTSAYRTMDLIQDVMRRRSPHFLMSSQIYAVEMRISLQASELFTALPAGGGSGWFRREYVWEETASIVY